MLEQIIYHQHTPQRVWDALEQRSRQTRQRLNARCPSCAGEIHPTKATHLRCRSCDAPVSVFQHRHHTDTADTRIIYILVKGQIAAVLRLDLHCLSCEQTLKTDETCLNTCGIQTYLISEHSDGELYIKRWLNRTDVKRETPEIEIRPLPDNAIAKGLPGRRETPEPNQTVNQPHARDTLIDQHPNAHTDIATKILKYLTHAKRNTATTKEMIAAIRCTPEGFNKARKKLQTHRRIRQKQRGVYELINQNQP